MASSALMKFRLGCYKPLFGISRVNFGFLKQLGRWRNSKERTNSVVFSLVCVGRAFQRQILNSRKRFYYVSGSLLGVSLWKVQPCHSEAKESEKNRKQHNAIIKKADELYENYLIDHVYNGLHRFRNSDESEMLWRLARATCEKAKLSRSKKDKQELFTEAFEYIEKALQCEPEEGSFPVHKWYAILLNYKTELEGTKAQLQRSPEVRQHLEKAIALNPNDATTWHILGIWHFTFADMPSYQRYLASAIFAKPPESDYNTALEIFMKAEQIQPNFYSKNSTMIGKTLMRLNENEKAKPYLESAFKRIVVSADDYDAHKEAAVLLKKLGIDKNV